MFIYIDNKKVSIKEAQEILGVSARDIPYNSKNKVFERKVPKRYDPISGKPINPRALIIPAQFNCLDKNKTPVNVRYVTQARQRPKSHQGDIIYSPLSIGFIGKNRPVPDDNDALFFFLFLNPLSANSPLNRGKRVVHADYEYVDREARAKSDMSEEDTLYEAIGVLRGYGERELRQIAKGYEINHVDGMSKYEVEKEVREILKRNPQEFINQMDAEEIALKGVVIDAIDKGALTHQEGGGQKEWHIGKDFIMKTKLGESHVIALSQLMAGSPDVFDMLEEALDNIENNQIAPRNEIKADLSRFRQRDNEEQPYNSMTPTDKKAVKEALVEQEGKTDENGLYWPAEKLTDKYQERLTVWAKSDINNPDLHHGVKQALNNPNNQPYIEAKRRELAAKGELV